MADSKEDGHQINNDSLTKAIVAEVRVSRFFHKIVPLFLDNFIDWMPTWGSWQPFLFHDFRFKGGGELYLCPICSHCQSQNQRHRRDVQLHDQMSSCKPCQSKVSAGCKLVKTSFFTIGRLLFAVGWLSKRMLRLWRADVPLWRVENDGRFATIESSKMFLGWQWSWNHCHGKLEDSALHNARQDCRRR